MVSTKAINYEGKIIKMLCRHHVVIEIYTVEYNN